MSRDPFEELFGSSNGESPETAPAPVPARDRLAYEQAERVRTTQLPTGKRTPPAGTDARTGDRAARAKPWIVVGIIAVLAIIASIVILNIARGSQEAPQPTAQPTAQPTTTPSQPSTPTADAADDGADDDDAEAGDEVPSVDPGPTSTLPITQWGVNGELSTKFGMTSYRLENDNTYAVLDSPLIQQLPCPGDWGVINNGDGTFAVLKPAERCAAAPELYDELWGLTDALVQTLR